VPRPAAPSPEVSHRRAQVAASKRHRGADDPRSIDAVRVLRETMLAEHIQRIVDSAPPLSAEQRSRLAVLLLGPAGDGHGGGRAA
jgi:hypothetical protein